MSRDCTDSLPEAGSKAESTGMFWLQSVALRQRVHAGLNTLLRCLSPLG